VNTRKKLLPQKSEFTKILGRGSSHIQKDCKISQDERPTKKGLKQRNTDYVFIVKNLHCPEKLLQLFGIDHSFYRC
jgi:hypothetical protein